jgi:proteasome accessory factor BC
MAERPTAADRLSRILEILPRAAREGGAPLDELAQTLDTDESSLLADLEEVYTRAYYHPAGCGEDVQILIESDHVSLWTAGEFRRPLRLTAREALALGLGLRVLASNSTPSGRARLVALAERLETELASTPPDDLLTKIEVRVGGESADGLRALAADAARQRRRCRIEYLKPRATEPDEREVDPFVILLADARWYLVGHCHNSGEVRVFRLDRVLSLTPLETTFTIPEDFDPDAFVTAGRVYRSEDDVEVEVRYSPRIARWIEEHGPVIRLDDGSVLVRYRVADPAWIVSHVLAHGPDAELVSPPDLRARLLEALRR